uniref:Uncharacterized protein n=1 Tax=Vespula pensylvanica TaxID=30213 RepID=A0A834U568_VESPE|nr:hypothetical protein H0235_011760 [Vespula pensylvanica]
MNNTTITKYSAIIAICTAKRNIPSNKLDGIPNTRHIKWQILQIGEGPKFCPSKTQLWSNCYSRSGIPLNPMEKHRSTRITEISEKSSWYTGPPPFLIRPS